MESSPFSEWPEWMTQIYRQLPTFQIELDLKPVSKITFAAVDFLMSSLWPAGGRLGLGMYWEMLPFHQLLAISQNSLGNLGLEFSKAPFLTN